MIDLSALPALTAPLRSGAVVPAHLGSLHPVEQVLTFVLAFGPFVVLGIVVALRRRQDGAGDEAGDGAGDDVSGGRGEDGPGPQGRAERAGQADR